MDEITVLKNQVAEINAKLDQLMFSDRYVFSRKIKMQDGKDIELSTGTGTKIGTATTQKLGLWGVTPVVQPSSVGETTGFTAGAGGTAVKDVSTFTGNSGSTAYTISDIVKHLKAAGIILT